MTVRGVLGVWAGLALAGGVICSGEGINGVRSVAGAVSAIVGFSGVYEEDGAADDQEECEVMETGKDDAGISATTGNPSAKFLAGQSRARCRGRKSMSVMHLDVQ